MAKGPVTRLEAHRRALGLTLADLAGRAGVSPSLLQQVETGDIKCYPLLREKIASILLIREEEIFDCQERVRPL